MPDLRVRALQLLTRRDHSREELKARLAPHADSEEELDTVLSALQNERLLSDTRYAAQRVVARGSRLGNLRLKQELRQKGVNEEDIVAALPEAGDETERCQQVWRKKFGHPPESAEDFARQQRFLRYRGFSGEAIRQVLRGTEA